jgi:hypothetical protein
MEDNRKKCKIKIGMKMHRPENKIEKEVEYLCNKCSPQKKSKKTNV